MPIPDQHWVELLTKYAKEELTDAEKQRLNEFAQQHGSYKELVDSFTGEEKVAGEVKYMHQLYLEWASMERPTMNPAYRHKVVRRRWALYAAASIIVIAGTIAVSVYFTGSSDKAVVKTPTALNIAEKLPAREIATLTMSGGQVVELSAANNGKTFEDAHAQITNNDGQLVYKPGSAADGKEMANTINQVTTPAGGFYRVYLADGSLVWLNAMSSLKYPVRFIGSERRVELEGEAFFTVAKDPAKPFIVAYKGGESRVLGTRFNLKAYPDERVVSTALVEGSVEVSNAGTKMRIKPGQVALINSTDQQIRIDNQGVDMLVAWTEGLFAFDNASLDDVLRQIGRWYGVSFEYSPEVIRNAKALYLRVQRSLPLPELLNYIERTGGVHFTADHDKIKVSILTL